MNFHQLIQYKVLDRLHTIVGSFPIERLPAAEIQKLDMRNVCALLPVPVFEKLESKCALLGLSKRDFIEAALSDAFVKVDRVVDEIGLHAAMWEHTHGAPYPGDQVAAEMHFAAQEGRK